MTSATVQAAEAGSEQAAESVAYFMYVVRCADDTLYTGYTTDVARRVAAHNAGRGAKYTRSRLPVILVHVEVFADKHDGLSAEYRFKRLSRAEKLARIAAQADFR